MRGKPWLLTGNELDLNCTEFVEESKRLIKAEIARWNREGVILGLDGGLGSAVVASLASQALGVGRVKALLLSYRDGNQANLHYAFEFVHSLNMRYKVCDVMPMLSTLGTYRATPFSLVPNTRLRDWLISKFQPHYAETIQSVAKAGSLYASLGGTRGFRDPWLNKTLAYRRALSRQQMVALYYHAELENFLVLGSYDRTDNSLGLFVKYGEKAVDLAPLRLLLKTQVRQLANFLGLPPGMINNTGLTTDLMDEDELGLSTDEVDRILMRLDRGQDSASIAMHLDLETEQVEYISQIVKRVAQMQGQPKANGW